MAEESFEEEKILRLEDLIKNLHRKTDHEIEKLHREVDRETEKLHREVEKTHRNIDRETDTTGSEILRRSKMKEDYYKAVSEIEKPTMKQVFSVLEESGGSHHFTDIQRFVGCSSSTLDISLRELGGMGLVRHEGGLYQAASPAWFAQKKLEQKEKTKETSINRSKPV